MSKAVKRDVFHTRQEFDKGRIAGDVEAQRQGVDEKPDERFKVRPRAIGRRHADQQVVLAGEGPCGVGGESSQDRDKR